MTNMFTQSTVFFAALLGSNNKLEAVLFWTTFEYVFFTIGAAGVGGGGGSAGGESAELTPSHRCESTVEKYGGCRPVRENQKEMEEEAKPAADGKANNEVGAMVCESHTLSEARGGVGRSPLEDEGLLGSG
ncbi:hypothetical protein Salat_1678300 [Sesamum alatum]|uniref:Uncharacterized protein n=1 Tax=Sesamum alatum TaxID=300844 RepID=A0AAE2CJW5_9LAMI|nr:hypothetical protein Salat_1678300 [Sesamum alatum]